MELDAGLSYLHHEHAQTPVLRDVPIRAGQTERPIGPPGARGPDLRAVEHPFVAVADGRREGPGQVRATAGLGEELHPEGLALENGRDVEGLLLFGAELQNDGHARGHGGNLRVRKLVAPDLPVECRLVGRGQSLASVGAGDADPGEAAVEEQPLELPTVLQVGELLLIVAPGSLEAADAVGGARHVLRQPGPGAGGEVLDALHVVSAHEATCRAANISVSRAACWLGVPRSAALVTTRRRNRCRWWSKVTPIPPCICTQSCTSSGPYRPT